MTLTTQQRRYPSHLIQLVCDMMKRDGKVELDCGHYALYGHTEQEMTILETDPGQFIIICGSCASNTPDDEYAFLLTDDNEVNRDPEEEPDETAQCQCHQGVC